MTYTAGNEPGWGILGANLRFLRENAWKTSQEDLGKCFGVGRAIIAKIEDGHGDQVRKTSQIVAAFGLAVSDLFDVDFVKHAHEHPEKLHSFVMNFGVYVYNEHGKVAETILRNAPWNLIREKSTVRSTEGNLDNGPYLDGDFAVFPIVFTTVKCTTKEDLWRMRGSELRIWNNPKWENVRDLIAFAAPDDSMFPMFMKNEPVLVDLTKTTPLPGLYYLIERGTSNHLRIYREHSTGLKLFHTWNFAGDPIEADSARVIGQVISRHGELT